MMKTTATTFIALLLTAVNAHAFEAVATVVSAVPINETVNTPTQNCWTEYPQQVQPAPPQHDYLGAIVGGVAGGLLGSRIGEGNGRVAGAAAGAGIGAIVGDRLDNRDSPSVGAAAVPVQKCQQVDHLETRTTGYQVTYEYDGQRFLTRLPYNPGSQLRVNVAVTPQ